MADIVISEFMDEDVLETSLKEQDYLFDPGLVDAHDQLLAAVADARALVVRNRTQVKGELLDAAKHLKVIGRLGVGLDNIDVDACMERDIAVCPASGANDLSVAEYVVTATMMLLRKAWLASSAVSSGDWPRMQLMGREISGKHMGLIGFGAIARKTAARVNDLGMSVCAYDPYLSKNDSHWAEVKKVDLSKLLESSDVISLHVPLTDETHHFINKNLITKMKQGAILINAARGGIVDEKALVGALNSNRLGGAALDVFETEPVTAATGELFKDVQNLILTPHIAGVTEESNTRVSQATIDNVLMHLN